MVQCLECGMWRLVYAKKKLSAQAKRGLERKLCDLDLSCGASLFDLDLPTPLRDVDCRDLRSEDPVEKLYYSMGYEPICIYCSSEDDLDNPEECYPICASCASAKQLFRPWLEFDKSEFGFDYEQQTFYNDIRLYVQYAIDADCMHSRTTNTKALKLHNGCTTMIGSRLNWLDPQR